MNSTTTRAFYAWLIQPTDCPKWVETAAVAVALLATSALLAWDFIRLFAEEVHKLNDALAATAVWLTCTAADIEYYKQLDCQTQPSSESAPVEVLPDVPSVAVKPSEKVKELAVTQPNRATRRLKAKKTK